ncbi:MAG: GEVED domain-containing protein [Bacteroidales bacterium]
MKQLTSLVIALLFFTSLVYSQGNIIFHENFEIPGHDDSVSYLSSPTTGYTWNINSRLHNGANSLYSDSCQVKTGTTVYLYTDTINTSGNYAVTLIFDQICKVNQDAATLAVSNDGGITWVQLNASHYQGTGTFFYSPLGYKFDDYSYGNLWAPYNNSAIPQNNWWRTEVFDISTLASNSDKVIVRFTLTDAGVPGPNGFKGWYLDNIKVTESFSETLPPVITPANNIVTGTIFDNGPITIKAKITDQSGINAARILYSVNNSIIDSVEMILSTNDTMFGILPGFNDNDQICWYFIAYDNSPLHNARKLPENSCYQFYVSPYLNLPYSDSFDDSISLWKSSYGGSHTNTSWQRGVPAYGVTDTVHSSPYAWDVNLTSAYNNYANCILTSPVFNFAGYNNSVVSFWINYNTEPDYDVVWIEYTTNGISWNKLGHVNDTLATNWYNGFIGATEQGWSGNSNGWMKCTYNLNFLNYQNGPVQFRFIFISDLAVNGDGFSVDDFSISRGAGQDAALNEVNLPLSGCGLGIEPVVVKVMNKGTDAISGGLTLGYKKADWTPAVIELLNDTILPTDSIIYIFNTPVDLSSVGADSIFKVKVWVTLPNDSLHNNDTLTKKIISKFLPEAPESVNITIPFGTSITLSVTSPYSINWYSELQGGIVLGTGSTFTTPLLYNNAVFYPGATGLNGCQGPRAIDTIFVSQALPFDVATIDLVSPISGYNLSSESSVIPIIKNFGNQAVSDFSIAYQVDNLSIVSETYLDTLLPGETDTITFNTPANLEAYQTYLIRSWIYVSENNNQFNDTITKFITNNMYNYCESKAFYANHMDIGSITISNLNHGNSIPVLYNPTSSSTYHNYSVSVPPINLIQDQSFDVQVNPIYTTSFYKTCCKIYVDWNDDGQFSEETETAFSAGPNNTTNIGFSGSITVPANAVTGIIRFRVISIQANNPSDINACEIYDYGETEDYSAYVYPAPNIDAAITSLNSPSETFPQGFLSQPSIRVKNNGTQDIVSFEAFYQIDNGNPVSEVWFGTLIPGQSTILEFPSVILPDGPHTFITWVNLDGDQISFNDSVIINTQSITISSIPFYDNFDSVTSFIASGNNTNWILGEPNPQYFPGTSISAPNVWCTNLNSSGYLSNANCSLGTQYFDFTDVYDAKLSFWMKVKSEGGYDGTRLEYTLNNGVTWNVLGSINDSLGVNWYNYLVNSSMLPGWTGNSTVWKKVSYLLTHLNNSGLVRFRFVFTSDGTTQNYGMAIDDFSIVNIINNVSLEKVSLITNLYAGDSNQVNCTIKNLGNDVITSLPIGFRVNNLPLISETWVATPGNELHYKDTVQFTFATLYEVPAGNYTLKVYTQLSGDTDLSNDTLSLQLFGNIPCQAIISSLDTLNTMPVPVDSTMIKICTNQVISFIGKGIYPENDIFYHQSDSTSVFFWDFGDGNTAFGKTAVNTFQQEGEYHVKLWVKDSNNCFSINNVVAKVVVSGKPLVECSPDQYFYEPVTTLLSCYVLSGISPYIFNWSMGEQDISVIVSVSETTTYYVTVTDANGCQGIDSIVVTIGSCPEITGQVIYDNTSQTPIAGAGISLSFNGNVIADTLTNQQGAFDFTDLCEPGMYNLDASLNAVPGGFNSSDALLSLQYFVNMTNLSPLQQLAGDVDGSGMINAADALSIVKRFVGLTSSFQIENWVFDDGSFEMFSGQSSLQNIEALCAGDVDGSFNPSLKDGPSVHLSQEGEIRTALCTGIILPVTCRQDLSLGAISLVFIVPAEIDKINSIKIVNDDNSTLGTLVYNLTGNKLYIAWYGLYPLLLEGGDVLLTLDVDFRKNRKPPKVIFSLDEMSILADENALKYTGVDLEMPKVILSEEAFWLGQNRPNPFQGITEISFNLPEEASVSLTIYNLLGECISKRFLMNRAKGIHTCSISAGDFVPGVYHYVLEAKSQSALYHGERRMIVME